MRNMQTSINFIVALNLILQLLAVAALDPNCGQVQRTAKIVGGSDAFLGEYPWITKIGVAHRGFVNQIQYICSGMVISEKFVLTAAHCISSFRFHSLMVAFGDFNLDHAIDCDSKMCADPLKILSVVKKIPYNPAYTPYEDDIVLLKLNETLQYSEWIKPICLPEYSNVMNQLLGHDVIAIGWGYVDAKNIISPKILQAVKIPILPLNNCKIYSVPIQRGFFCAGTLGRDTCNGDSGSPVFKLFNTSQGFRYMLLGIVSFGSSDCGSYWPGVYTDVSFYLNWILVNIR